MLDLVHIDLGVPYSVKVVAKTIYFVTIVDDHYRVACTHLLANKEQVKEILIGFLAHVENQFKSKVKTLKVNYEMNISARMWQNPS